MVSTISPYRNVFIALTAIMLGLAHYFMSKNKGESTKTKVVLWISTLVSVGLILYSSFFSN